MREIWKLIKGYEPKYEVSNFGRVRTLLNTHREKLLKPKIIKQRLRDGYPQIALWKIKVRKDYNVHKLVASCFLQKSFGRQVHHKDRNRTNNKASNLEWKTAKENASLRGVANRDPIQKKAAANEKPTPNPIAEWEMPLEIWKPTKTIPSRYEVSSLGRFRCIRKLNGRLVNPPKIRKVTRDKRGYGRVNVVASALSHSFFATHREVAAVFLDPPQPDQVQVNHRDSNPFNDRASNLEWATPKQNQQHASAAGRKSHGIQHWNSKLKEKDVQKIRHLSATMSGKKLALLFGVTRTTIRSIILRKSWARTE